MVLPKKFRELQAKDSAKTSLRKRSQEDKPDAEESKPSIKDRIKVREDAKDKRIKVAAVAHAETAEDSKDRENAQSKSKKDPSKVRCHFYPSCNKPDCPFVHPREPVSSPVPEVSEVRLRRQVHIHPPVHQLPLRSHVPAAGLRLRPSFPS